MVAVLAGHIGNCASFWLDSCSSCFGFIWTQLVGTAIPYVYLIGQRCHIDGSSYFCVCMILFSVYCSNVAHFVILLCSVYFYAV